MSGDSPKTFRFISAEITSGWLQLIDTDGVWHGLRLEWATALEHDPAAAMITVYADDLVWRFGSGISQSRDLDVNVYEARRDAVHDLYEALREQLISRV